MYASYPKKCYFFDAIFTSGKFSKLIRMCQPQSFFCGVICGLHLRLASQIIAFLLLESIRSFGQGLMSHQQGDAILYDTCGEFDCLLKANFVSKLLAEIQGIVWLEVKNNT